MNFQQWTRSTQRKLTEQGGGKYFTQKDVDRVMRGALEVLKEELRDGGELSLVDIGRLYTEQREAYTVRSNLPYQTCQYFVPSRIVAVFKASEALKKSLNSR